MTGQRKATPEGRWPFRWQRPFLAALAAHGVVAVAARAAKIDRPRAYKVRQADPAFAAAWDAAVGEAVDLAELEARRRAVAGVSRPVLHNGKPVFVYLDAKGEIVPAKAKGARRAALVETRYSDDLLKFYLKARRPEVFGDRTVLAGDKEHPIPHAHSGTVTHDHQLDHVISPDALREFAADLAAAGLDDLQDDGQGQPVGQEGADPAA